MPHVPYDKLRVYVGLGLAFVFSVFFLTLLLRRTLLRGQASTVNWKVSAALGMATLASVALVGDAPYVSLVQGVAISIGCLFALHHHITHAEVPSARIVGTLAGVMLATLLINQASNRFKIGILDWFTIDVAAAGKSDQVDEKHSSDTAASRKEVPQAGRESLTAAGDLELTPGTPQQVLSRRYVALYVAGNAFECPKLRIIDKAAARVPVDKCVAPGDVVRAELAGDNGAKTAISFVVTQLSESTLVASIVLDAEASEVGQAAGT